LRGRLATREDARYQVRLVKRAKDPNAYQINSRP